MLITGDFPRCLRKEAIGSGAATDVSDGKSSEENRGAGKETKEVVSGSMVNVCSLLINSWF